MDDEDMRIYTPAQREQPVDAELTAEVKLFIPRSNENEGEVQASDSLHIFHRRPSDRGQ